MINNIIYNTHVSNDEKKNRTIGEISVEYNNQTLIE
jgi:hypothetical protein